MVVVVHVHYLELLSWQQTATRGVLAELLKQWKRKHKLLRQYRARVNIGRCHSWLPKKLGKKRCKPIDFFSKMVFERQEEWTAMFGSFTAVEIQQIADSLPFAHVRKHKISLVNKVALFLNRMRTGHNFAMIALRFGMSQASAHGVFHDTLLSVSGCSADS